jgi:predicted Zn-dependent protease
MTSLAALAVTAAAVASPLPPYRCPYGCESSSAAVESAWQAFARDVADSAAAQDPPANDKEAKQQENHRRELTADTELGKKYSADVDKELKPSEDAEANERLQKIGAQFAAIANQTPVNVLWGDKRLNPFSYTFKLVKGKDVNAFSLPGGYIYFYEGLLDYVESDDELAGVVAHEVAHASLRHVATLQREQSRVNAIQLPLILLAIFTGGASAAGTAIGLGGLVGTAVGSGWSVRAEQAADYAGFQYMLKSSYNTSGILTMMERLARDERAQPSIDWGIYRTHPPSRERAESLEGFIKSAGRAVERSKVTTSFRFSVRPGDNRNVELLFGKRRIVALAGAEAIPRADAAAAKLNPLFDQVPQLFEVQGGPDGIIYVKRREVLKIEYEDAQMAGTTVSQLTEDTVKNLRLSLFGLAFRIWDR